MINNHIIYNNNCCFGPYLCVYVCRMYVRQCYDAVGWAAGRASGQWWGAAVVICLERGADLHMFQLMPLPLTVSCFSKIQIGFTFLVPAHLGTTLLQPFNGLFSRTTWVSRYQKGKTNLDFTGARDSEWQWHKLDRMQVHLAPDR